MSHDPGFRHLNTDEIVDINPICSLNAGTEGIGIVNMCGVVTLSAGAVGLSGPPPP